MNFFSKSILESLPRRSHILLSFVLGTICFQIYQKEILIGFLKRNSFKCKVVVPDGGDCQAIGPRRPLWDCPEKMRNLLPKFLNIFEKRPFRENGGGMRLEHSFAVWFMLRSLQPRPKVVIESGVHRGHGTWLIRQALPKAKIICIDVNHVQHKENGTTYLTGKDFKDFNEIDWDFFNVDRHNTVILFDDHQSLFRRIVEESRAKGFLRFITDDNYDYLHGDAYSLKWTCERKGRREWPGYILDNFARENITSTWTEHYLRGELLRQVVKYYYEFPPIASVNLTKANLEPLTRSESFRASPLYTNTREFMSLGLDRYEAEYDYFTHISYVELLP